MVLYALSLVNQTSKGSLPPKEWTVHSFGGSSGGRLWKALLGRRRLWKALLKQSSQYLRARKRQGSHGKQAKLGGQSWWEAFVVGFAGAKLAILRARKRQGSTWETSEAGRLSWEVLRVESLPM